MIDPCLLLCYHAGIDCAPLRPDHMKPNHSKSHECLGGARGSLFSALLTHSGDFIVIPIYFSVLLLPMPHLRLVTEMYLRTS